jgi:hypothetical protein
MMRHHHSGPPGPPLSRGERIALAIVVTILAIAFVALGTVFVITGIHDHAKTQAMHRAWDAGHGRPQAVKLVRGQTVRVPATVRHTNQYWDNCTYKTCPYQDMPHYPVAMPMSDLSFQDGCYSVEPSNHVRSIMVAATAGATYTAHFTSTGNHLIICNTGRQHNNDVIVWSDDPAAAH